MATTPDTAAGEHHAPVTSEEIARTFEEAAAPVDLSGHGPEDWLALALFWVMCLAVFLQFFTRYVLNNSFAWTEEIAIYCLVVVVFLGAAMCARTSRHIHVDFLYRYLSPAAGRGLSLMVDVVRIGVFGYIAWLVWRYAELIHDERMTTVDLPKSPLFYTVFAAFVLMALRSVQVMIGNLRRGYSVLERPSAFDTQMEG